MRWSIWFQKRGTRKEKTEMGGREACVNPNRKTEYRHSSIKTKSQKLIFYIYNPLS